MKIVVFAKIGQQAIHTLYDVPEDWDSFSKDEKIDYMDDLLDNIDTGYFVTDEFRVCKP